MPVLVEPTPSASSPIQLLPRMSKSAVLLLMGLAILLSSCTAPWTMRRTHDLKPGEMRGSVFIVNTGDPAPLSSPLYERIHAQIAAILARAGLTRTVDFKSSNWLFGWSDTLTKHRVGLNVHENYASESNVYGHDFTACLVQRPQAKIRWNGQFLVVLGDANSDATLEKRIRLLMDPFPGVVEKRGSQ